MICNVLEVLEYAFAVSSSESTESALKATAVKVTSSLLTLPTPFSLQMRTFALLAALHPSRAQYHAHKDHVLLTHVLESLKQMRDTSDPRDIDAENFYRLVLIVRGIAIARPSNLAKFTQQFCAKSVDLGSSKYTSLKQTTLV